MWLRNTWTFVDRGTRSDPTPEPAIAALVACGSLPVSAVLTNCHPITRLAPPPRVMGNRTKQIRDIAPIPPNGGNGTA